MIRVPRRGEGQGLLMITKIIANSFILAFLVSKFAVTPQQRLTGVGVQSPTH